jgi:hypothetical protein
MARTVSANEDQPVTRWQVAIVVAAIMLAAPVFAWVLNSEAEWRREMQSSEAEWRREMQALRAEHRALLGLVCEQPENERRYPCRSRHQ